MAFCTACGAQNDDGAKFCIYCGEKLEQSEQPVSSAPEEPSYAKPELNEQPPQHIYQQPTQQTGYQQTASAQPGYQTGSSQTGYQQPGGQQTEYQQAGFGTGVAPMATGGLLAWSIVSILLCLIPGVVALVQTLGINKCATVEEQQKKYSSAKLWCIISTVLGVLSIIGNLAARS